MKSNELEHILVYDGIFAKGFGTVGKIVMQDRRLTAYSKAIYAYFCSYAGGGSTAFPGVSKIIYDLDISKRTYYKHFGLLVEYGYISVYQRKCEGKFSTNIYKINTNPKKTPKKTEKSDTTNKNTNVPNEYYYDWMTE